MKAGEEKLALGPAGEAEKPSRLVQHVREAFSPHGLLTQKLPSFVPRESQREFAEAVAQTIEEKGTLVAEAGTGTGKTFAYLVPALFSGIRVLVSTAGKPLQDQLYSKDLPLILEALDLHANTVLLKGRSNYICKKRLEEVDWVPSKEDVGYLRDIQIFSRTSQTGDRSELGHIPENAMIWPLVTSTKVNCLGTKCPLYDDCFLTKARREAKEADILVVNHHLFLSSLAIADEGADEILPSMPLTVIDEAHQLPGIATDFFGDLFSTNAVLELARDTLQLGKTNAKDGANWDVVTSEVDRSAKEVALSVSTKLDFLEGDRKSVDDIPDLGLLIPDLEQLGRALSDLSEVLKANKGRNADIDLLLPRCENFIEQVNDWLMFASGQEEDAAAAEAVPEGIDRKPLRLPGLESEAEAVSDGESPRVRWVQQGRTGTRFYNTPLSFAEDLNRLRHEKGEAWVFTSATLSVAGDFSHFLTEIGLPDAKTASWPSPFDYFSLASLYLPKGLPEPNSPAFPESVARSAWPFVKKAGGRTFFLCTSLRAVDIIADTVKQLANEDGMPLRVLRQGDGTRRGLIEEFRKDPASVLVGSMSFWEGIDIKGETLSVVVIDRIPFSPPDDPVVAARCKWIRDQGGKPFFDYQVPEAVTLLRQGAGRLIRSETDHGVFILCDSRIITKWNSYGRTVVESLPDFCRTQDPMRALAYLPEQAAAPKKTAGRRKKKPEEGN